MKKQEILIRVFSWIITILVPLTVIMLAVRVLITPLFPRIEYRLPGFPDDPYGFTLGDRLRWSAPAVKYLVNARDISYLAELRFDDGEPLFNARELRHMQDVKGLVTGMRIALIASCLIIAVLLILAWRRKALRMFVKGGCRGGWGLIGLVAIVLLFILLNFNNLFTWFHQVFFESGTWMFYTSDTLIRLFPMRFWQDAFIFVFGVSFLAGVLIVFFCRRMQNNSTNQA
jgi:integral membrane protein (TIGR01906 family)